MFSPTGGDYAANSQAHQERNYPLPLKQNQLLKLQAHKSSFQSWKCVSFGCSLLAIVLLTSKWHEVSTDLNLLNGINQLLVLANPSATNLIDGDTAAAGEANQSSPVLASWPPIPLDEATINALGGSSASSGLAEAANDSATLLSHMTLSLNRELSGNQLLRQDVEAFAAEFRASKSTLSLSTLLVSVYLVSWILMTLAINDARISNDISLRNILLLSVFGAIDLAASAGFVMVRVIMYSVKNNPFASQVLNSNGFRDLPTRLSPDQLTAFTALRLIAMRSSSAYVDIYVSIVVSALTLLRIYAIMRALSYYRRLRRFNELAARTSTAGAYFAGHREPHLGEPQHQLKPSASMQLAPVAGHVWSTPSSGQAPGSAQMNHSLTMSNNHRLAGVSSSHQYQQRAGGQSLESEAGSQRVADVTQARAGAQSSEQPSDASSAPVLLVQATAKAPNVSMNPDGDAGQMQHEGVVLVDGKRARRLLLAAQQADECESEPVQRPRPRLRRPSGGSEVPPHWSLEPMAQVPYASRRFDHTLLSDSEAVARQYHLADPRLYFTTKDRSMATAKRAAIHAHPRVAAVAPQAPTFTVLSAEQLEKLGKRLVAAGSAKTPAMHQSATTGRGGKSTSGAQKRSAAAQLQANILQATGQRRAPNSLVVGTNSSLESPSSSANSSADDRDSELSEAPTASARHKLAKTSAKLLGMRQTEEFVAAAGDATGGLQLGQHLTAVDAPAKFFSVSSPIGGKNGDYLIGKYYYA